MGHVAPFASVISALADALWPSEETGDSEAEVTRFFATSAGDVPLVTALVVQTIHDCVHGIDRLVLTTVLNLLRTRWGTLLLAGRHSLSRRWPFVLPFAALPTRQRQDVLLSWACSPLVPFKVVFKVLKSLICAMITAHVDDAGDNPFWAAMGYVPGSRRGPVGGGGGAPLAAAREAEEVLASGVVHCPRAVAAAGAGGLAAFLERRGFAVAGGSGVNAGAGGGGGGLAAELQYDAVVVGSGAGGGVAAAQLTAAGMRVLVVEKGLWMRLADVSGMELESLQRAYENCGLVGTDDAGLAILAGSGLGGGTKINWCASLHTPDHVRREWADAHGLAAFAPGGSEFEASLDAVCERLGVHSRVQRLGSNAAVFNALAAVDATPQDLPRNCSSEVCSTYCNAGCKSGHKQSTDVTFLADAVRMGARVLTGCKATKVLLERNPRGASSSGDAHERPWRAVGLELEVVPDPPSAGGQLARLVVHAPVVVVACGALHSPVLLLRSGLRGRGNVGAHLRVHPATGVMARFPPPEGSGALGRGSVEMYEGAMMSTYSTAAAHWSSGGYGAMLSVPVCHPGLAASLMVWHRGFKRDLTRMGDVATSLVFTRDTGGGRVTVGAGGRPSISYWPTPADVANLLEGMELLIRGFDASGAAEVMVPIYGVPRHRPADGPASLEAMVAALRRLGLPKYQAPLFSAHQMGTCRLGSSPRTSVCSPEGECWEAAGLFVADGSALPTASGVNPMITIEAVAHMITGGIARRFKSQWRQQGNGAATGVGRGS